ncbi:MAG: hypothetical protein AAB225_09235 [Acidobacteriota bacterium]
MNRPAQYVAVFQRERHGPAPARTRADQDAGPGRPPAGEYSYPLQDWQFGPDLTFIGTAGEAVADYSPRLKRELGTEKLWVSASNNDVSACIPSLRVLQEGSYEGGGAMVGARLPGALCAGGRGNDYPEGA